MARSGNVLISVRISLLIYNESVTPVYFNISAEDAILSIGLVPLKISSIGQNTGKSNSLDTFPMIFFIQQSQKKVRLLFQIELFKSLLIFNSGFMPVFFGNFKYELIIAIFILMLDILGLTKTKK